MKIIRKYLLLFIFLFSSAAFSETNPSDSMIARLDSVKGEVKVDLLNEVADIDSKTSPDKCLRYAKQALELSLRIKYTKGEAAARKNIGIIYRFQGDFSSAEKYLKGAIALGERYGYNDITAASLHNIGSIYLIQSDYEKALEYFLSAVDEYKSIGDVSGEADVYRSIGIVYMYLENYEKSISFAETAMKAYLSINDKKGIASSYNNIGIDYDKMGRKEDALEYYKKSLTIKREIADTWGISNTLANIGLIYKSLNDPENALKYSNESLQIKREMGDKKGIASTMNNIGEILTLMKRYDEALKYIRDALKIADVINVKSLRKDSCFLLSQIYEAMNNPRKSYDYYKMYAELEESIFTEESAVKITELQSKHEIEKKEKEIEILKRDKHIKDLEYKRQSFIRNTFVVGFVLILFFAVLIYNQYKLKTISAHELSITNEYLQSSLDEIDLLEKLLPICANCQRIREDDGGWSQVDAYFSKHSDARFSKSICPKCEETEKNSKEGQPV